MWEAIQAIKDWWAVITGIGTVIGMIGATLYKSGKERRKEIARLKHRIGDLENEHEAHKDSCAQRWQQLKDSNQRRDQHIDERHTENLQRLARLDSMLVELLRRNDMRRGQRDDDK